MLQFLAESQDCTVHCIFGKYVSDLRSVGCLWALGHILQSNIEA